MSLSDRIRGIVGGAPTPHSAIAAQPGIRNPESAHRSPHCDLSTLGGEWRDGAYVVERRYDRTARHGHETVGAIADRVRDAASHASWFTGGTPAPPPFVFFDLETTGLSGGAGTQAFLVGCASFDADGGFSVRQWFLTSPANERCLLAAVRATLAPAGALVSFNGKSFDAPLLETRYLFHRLTWDGRCAPHVDVLHPARRFWGNGTRTSQAHAGLRQIHSSGSDCSLVSLERHLVGVRRVGDVAGFEVPARYFQFVRTGDARPLAPVFEHNRLDLLTLAALSARLLHLARMGASEAARPREALALGHLFARAGMEAQAREAFERSLSLCAAPAGAFDATRVEAMRALALAWRRARRFDRAATLWSELLEVRGCPPSVAREATEALAVHHEHRLRDLPAARVFALRGLDADTTAAATSSSWTNAVRHRVARIDRKMRTRTSGPLAS